MVNGKIGFVTRPKNIVIPGPKMFAAVVPQHVRTQLPSITYNVKHRILRAFVCTLMMHNVHLQVNRIKNFKCMTFKHYVKINLLIRIITFDNYSDRLSKSPHQNYGWQTNVYKRNNDIGKGCKSLE